MSSRSRSGNWIQGLQGRHVAMNSSSLSRCCIQFFSRVHGGYGIVRMKTIVGTRRWRYKRSMARQWWKLLIQQLVAGFHAVILQLGALHTGECRVPLGSYSNEVGLTQTHIHGEDPLSTAIYKVLWQDSDVLWQSLDNQREVLLLDNVTCIRPKQASVTPIFCPLCKFPIDFVEDLVSYRTVQVCWLCDLHWIKSQRNPDTDPKSWQEYLADREQRFRAKPGLSTS